MAAAVAEPATAAAAAAAAARVQDAGKRESMLIPMLVSEILVMYWIEGVTLVPMKAGGLAGLAADVLLFPIDSIKTRLQSAQGFRASGGLSRVYAGLASASLGSVPSAAVFFLTYESAKQHFQPLSSSSAAAAVLVPAAAAATGETVACAIRVPVEVIKQRTQAAARASDSSLSVLRRTIAQDGMRGLYRGFGTMVAREIPFAFIQFPLWEGLKARLRDSQSGQPLSEWQACACGAAAGGLAAAATNPLDVCKTRVMLGSESGMGSALRAVLRQRGWRGLAAGIVPRVAWISVGGAVFLGGYDAAHRLLLHLSS